MVGLLMAVSALAVFVQGGYFPVFFLLAGVGLGLGLALLPGRLPSGPWLMGLCGLSMWYLVATWLQSGDMGQAGLPLVCTLFAGCLATLTPQQRDAFVLFQCRLGGLVALLALLAFFGLLPLEGAVTAGRLQFTFQYVNAFGSWLATIALLRWQVKDRWVAYTYPLVLVALLLTRSAGAIGLFLVVQLALLLIGQKNRLTWKHLVPMGLALLAGIAALSTRWAQILGTFSERLTHTHDGFLALLASPLLGHGAGTWGTVKAAFQSYDYQATVIHNSYMQIAVSTGFIGALLFLLALILALPKLKNRPLPWVGAALLLLGHAVMDFTLCFLAIDTLALALLVPQSEGNVLPTWVKPLLGLAGAGLCLALRLL